MKKEKKCPHFSDGLMGGPDAVYDVTCKYCPWCGLDYIKTFGNISREQLRNRIKNLWDK